MDPSTRPPAPGPGEQPPAGQRPVLDRAPGERYATQGRFAEPAQAGRGVPAGVVAVLIALAGAAVTVLLGGVLSLSAGLLLVAGATGWLIGRAMAAPTAGQRTASPVVPIALAAGSVAAGHLGLWLFATSEGGALGLLDYLAQTWGPLAVAQYAVAIAAAWLAWR